MYVHIYSCVCALFVHGRMRVFMWLCACVFVCACVGICMCVPVLLHNMYMCIYVVYTCSCVDAWVCVHLSYVQVGSCACMFICFVCAMYSWVCEFMHICAFVFLHMCSCVYWILCLNVYMCIHVCVFMCVFVCMAVCTCEYVHVCSCVCVWVWAYVCTYVQRMIVRQWGDKSEPQKIRVVSFPTFQK